MTERQRMMRRLRDLARRYSTASQTVERTERERERLYAEARALDPPITYRAIAEVFGVTEAAVNQKVKRHEARNGRRPPVR